MIRWYYRNVRIREPAGEGWPYIVEALRGHVWEYVGGSYDMETAVQVFVNAIRRFQR